MENIKKVLLFGAGMVAMPVVRLLGNRKDIQLYIASDQEAQTLKMIEQVDNHQERVTFISFNYPKDLSSISSTLMNMDMVISLLPAAMHISIAKLAIEHKKNMVTASYVSDGMRSLDEAAKEAGIVIMNEVGLDPGIDHMLIKKAIDNIHKQGGTVKELISLCGGLPDPHAANNPLKYKFSWSPKGVLTASCNAAVYLKDNKEISIDGGGSALLQSSVMCPHLFPNMGMEMLPNRNSLLYSNLYGVPSVDTICRGTLRYNGWSNIMHALHCLGLYMQESCLMNCVTWREYFSSIVQNDENSVEIDIPNLKERVGGFLKDRNVRNVTDAIAAIEWLGMFSEKKVSSTVPMDALCSLLQEKLQFEEGENDMVAMYHTVLGELPDGTFERHTSTLLAFGQSTGDTAMAATVGYTTVAAVELILFGNFKETGVLIPTKASVYLPILERIQELGISFTETALKTENYQSSVEMEGVF